MTKKKDNKKFRASLRDSIIKIFNDFSDKNMNYKQVAGQLNIKDEGQRKVLLGLMKELKAEGRLSEEKKGQFSLVHLKEKSTSGILDMTNKGNGYVVTESKDQDVRIPKNKLNTALDGDEVRVRLSKPKGRYNKPTGEVTEILKRDKSFYVGIVEKVKDYAFVIPDNNKMNIDFYIAKNNINGAEDGQKVIVELIDWPDPKQSPFGKITEILGVPGNNETEILSILADHELPMQFPDQVTKEAEKFSIDLNAEEVKNRRDFRDITTFTIDPEDAKDFDDALSYKELENGNTEVGIHIADVSYYVTPESQLDKEAYKRANSIYLVDRVIPMLPEQLSNLVCSLRPNEEKFVFSALFEITPKAKVVNKWFGKGVICSNERLAYQDAQDLIEGKNGDLKKEITQLNLLAQKFRKERLKAGAMEIESEEYKFKINKEGRPVGIEKKVQQDANKLIEEFMLLANRSVARYVGGPENQNPYPFIYRVHDKPDMGKLEVFKLFISKFGINIQFENENDIAKQLNKVLHKVKGTNEYDIIQQMAIKTMAKAEYSTKNIGHYGLHFDYYTHFTSPIRRYADLIVHRVLQDKLIKKTTPYNKNLNETAKHTSNKERKSVEAERDSNKYFQTLYMEDKVGGVYEATITGITSWGIYARINDLACEGMISLGSITDDHYYFEEKNYRIIGSRHKNEFNLGGSIKVQVVRVDTKERKIDFSLPVVD